ncbi:MAG: shikimate kinase [Pyrinomonadaceae bacterium]
MADHEGKIRIALTGFMGVGKSTVARNLSRLAGLTRIDLDDFLENKLGQSVPEYIKKNGIEHFRDAEAEALSEVIADRTFGIISLGGGTFISEANRRLLQESDITSIWLEAGFEHCWANIQNSYRERPLAGNRENAKRLYEERGLVYCLADWHFLIGSGNNSLDVAKQIAEQVFGIE